MDKKTIKTSVQDMMSKFSLAQMTSNASGKTSGSGTMGCLICVAGAIGFLWGTFSKQPNLINQAIIYTGFGAGLLGYRKSKESSNEGIMPPVVVNTEDTTDNSKDGDKADKADDTVEAATDPAQPLNS